MKKVICNPVNISYKYQFNEVQGKGWSLNREGADPSLITFKGRYYLFPSMTDGFLVSENLADWKRVEWKHMPLYGYAPDVRVMGEYIYFCASRRGEICDFYRTKDPESGEFERIPGTFDFWDPDMFMDDDGRVYFYWGCSNITPIWGVELDPVTMHKRSEPVALIEGHPDRIGYERVGENHIYDPMKSESVQMMCAKMEKDTGHRPASVEELMMSLKDLPKPFYEKAAAFLEGKPYIEGAWMTKHEGRYYLQYTCAGSEYNIYGDGVYVSDAPLGPFTLAENNPYSYEPGGFFPGAGHGSTVEDFHGNLWHTATMRISVNHSFERRVGLWPAGFDQDGDLFCNQRYGDWPRVITGGKQDPWKLPEWMLLSYKAKASTTSSQDETHGPEQAVNEDVQTWWKAAADDGTPALTLDLGAAEDVRAIQINYADDMGIVNLPEGAEPWSSDYGRRRYIEQRSFRTRWLLEGSQDGETWDILCDKREAETDLPHDLVVLDAGRTLRFLRLTTTELPYHQAPCVSGLRVFGRGNGEAPAAADAEAVRNQDDGREMKVTWTHQADAVGHTVLWGYRADKLYHSMQVLEEDEAVIRALVTDQSIYYVRVDAFNENGITEGKVIRLAPIE